MNPTEIVQIIETLAGHKHFYTDATPTGLKKYQNFTHPKLA